MSDELRKAKSEVRGDAGGQLASRTSPPSPRRRAWSRFRSNKAAWFSAWYLAGLVILVVLWPVGLGLVSGIGPRSAALAATYAPDRLSDAQFNPPSLRHWFGTDGHGRDVFSRVLYGARISLLVGVVGSCVSLVIGVSWGAVAGYRGGRVDSVLMRIVDVLYSLPSIIFVIVLLTTLGEWVKQWPCVRQSPSLAKELRVALLLAGLGAVSWLTMARVVRGQVLSLRTQPFVDASRALGAGTFWILRRHILPNVLGVAIVYLTLTVPAIVLYESFLSFLGLGIQPPMASWGSLLAEGVDQINPIRIYWWLVACPAAVLISTLLAFNFIGDGVRDAWDVRGTDVVTEPAEVGVTPKGRDPRKTGQCEDAAAQ
jgi:peptide/nickel transport system permease protein/oligopeptide transport system permease protein